jgi:hypothetical protein
MTTQNDSSIRNAINRSLRSLRFIAHDALEYRESDAIDAYYSMLANDRNAPESTQLSLFDRKA